MAKEKEVTKIEDELKADPSNPDAPVQEHAIIASSKEQLEDVTGESGATIKQIENPSLTIGNATYMTTSSEVVDPHGDLVKVKISYPDNHKGDMHLENGKIYPVSQEVADRLVKKGIAKIVKS